jgi:hypothetical protein
MSASAPVIAPAPIKHVPMSHVGITRAFVYLQATSIFNSLKQRISRMRQPKYLFGAIAGAAYMYYFLVRKVLFQNSATNSHGYPTGIPSELAPQLAAIAALAMLIVIVLAWIIPSARASLRFSEAEVAFLFPAPLTRPTLIHFSLLRSQIGIFFSAFLTSLILRRGGAFGGNPWQHAAGLWLLMSILNLHFLGASFARERLLEFGVRPALRRALIGGVALIVFAGCWWWVRSHVPLPRREDLAGIAGVRNYIASILGVPPVSWVLAPFGWIVGPMFATDTESFLRALLPATLLLVAHYFWVVRSGVSFEEASIDRARKRAERISAMREGKLNSRNRPAKARSAPFRLAPHGFAPIAFLWKGLIAMGPFWRLRTWLIACAIVIAGSSWLAADPARKPLLVILGTFAAIAGGWMFLAGPMLMQRSLRQTLEQLDILKASPLRGWQIALGQLLSPVAVMTFAQWLLLLMVAMAFGAKTGGALLTSANIDAAAIGIALLAAPLCGVMLCVPFAGLLYFPAWTAASSGSGGRGIEVMGQRMIFLGGYLVTLALALIPAILLGGLVFVIVQMLAGLPIALLIAALIAAAVLAAELAVMVRWLGRRIDGFDVSQELR